MTDEVGECGFNFEPDELPGYERATIRLKEEDDGPLVATLVRKTHASPGEPPRPAVLYVHGFVDYFFQTWLAEAFETAGYRFYAIDLRRYGRSLLPGNRANYATQVSDYFEELDAALDELKKSHGKVAGIVAHSTGALICALYLKHGRRRTEVETFITNSAFLHFALGPWNHLKMAAVVKLARLFPKQKLPERISATYGRTIHKSEQGEWDYDLSKKPLRGFPLYAGWFRMIREAHREVAQGLELELPILSLCSSQSRMSRGSLVPEDFCADLVLDVKDIQILSPRLGHRVTVNVIENGLHDLALSRESARKFAIDSMVAFVIENSSPRSGSP